MSYFLSETFSLSIDTIYIIKDTETMVKISMISLVLLLRQRQLFGLKMKSSLLEFF